MGEKKKETWISKNWIWVIAMAISLVWGTTFLLLYKDGDKGIVHIGNEKN